MAVVPEYSSSRKRPKQRWILHCFLTFSFIRQWKRKMKSPGIETKVRCSRELRKTKIGSWFVAPSSLSTHFLICTWARHFSVRTKKKWRLFVASLSDKKESNITKASQGKGSCEIVASHSLHLIFCFFICKFCWFPLNCEREAGCWGKTHCG